MKNNPNFETFRQAFSSRIEVYAALDRALDASVQDFERFKKACLELETTISMVGKGDVEEQYRAYLVAITIFVILAEWKHAIRNAEQDAQRFLSSAKLKASEVERPSADERLVIFLDQVAEVKSVNELNFIQDYLKQWSLPLFLFSNLSLKGFEGGSIPAWSKNLEKPEKLETTVAFLKFDIDGEPAQQWNYLKPGISYDLTIEVRVSHWPKGASSLSLKPVTVDIREKDWLPSFSFEEPEGDGPFILTGTGRAVLEIAHSFGSRPYEFLYAAE